MGQKDTIYIFTAMKSTSTMLHLNPLNCLGDNAPGALRGAYMAICLLCSEIYTHTTILPALSVIKVETET